MEPTVTINQGTLRGRTAKNFKGASFYSFQGIPYAKPPLGDLRFKAPLPPEKWTGILDATKEGSSCYSRNLLELDRIIGSEDCLFLNIYTKNLPKEKEENKLCPVMFFIHGGAFIFGSGDSDLYAPDFLMTQDIVLVTINYRLGMLGFLRLEDSSLEVTGNAGLKDMVMALKWVKDNIEKFNGDPNNVTIFGQSAGGAAVQLLMLSPMARGLFHKAIAQSGSAFNPWVQSNPNSSTIKQIETALCMEGVGEKAVLKILRQMSVSKIFELQETIPNDIILRTFGVVVEKESNQSAFLSKNPIEVVLSGSFTQVPFMCGFTNAEGIFFEIWEGGDNFALSLLCHLGYPSDSETSKILSNEIRKFYHQDEKASLNILKNKIDMNSDIMFLYGLLVMAKKHAEISRSLVYLYQVSLETSLNFMKKMAKIKEPGTSHMDDLAYLFKNCKTPEIKQDSLEEVFVKRFVKLWTNFAKYGDPTPDQNEATLGISWKPVEEHKMNYLDIGQKLELKCDPEPERMEFWTKVYANSPMGSKIVYN